MGLVWLARLCFSLLSPVLFPPLSQQGSGHRVHGYSPPAPLLPWGAAPPPNRPAGPGSASSSPRTRRPAPGKLGEGDTAKRKLWDLAGNNSWGRRCGLLCVVSLFSGRRLTRERAWRGRQKPALWISAVPPSPPASLIQVESDVWWWWCAGSPTPAWPPFCICLFHFCPCLLGPPVLPGSRLSVLTGARVCGVSSTVLTNKSCEKGEGVETDKPIYWRKPGCLICPNK